MKTKMNVIVCLLMVLCAASLVAAPLDYFGSEFAGETIDTPAEFLAYYELFVEDVELDAADGYIEYADFNLISLTNSEFSMLYSSTANAFSMMDLLAYSTLSNRLALAISDVEVGEPTMADLMSAYADTMNAYGYVYGF